MIETLIAAAGRVPAPSPEWGFGLGGAAVALALPAAWGAIHLRSKVFSDVGGNVDVARAGLEEKSLSVFSTLRDEIDRLLPAASAFNPESAIFDPGPFDRLARRAVKLARERARVVRQFRVLLIICSILKYSTLTFLGLALFSTAVYFLFFSAQSIWTLGRTACGICLGWMAIVFLAYVVVRQGIDRAIEDASQVSEMR